MAIIDFSLSLLFVPFLETTEGSKHFQRRRDRINEKMRALQELIPNSNKVCCAAFGKYAQVVSASQLKVSVVTLYADRQSIYARRGNCISEDAPIAIEGEALRIVVLRVAEVNIKNPLPYCSGVISSKLLSVYIVCLILLFVE